jgi:hypothetical protein
MFLLLKLIGLCLACNNRQGPVQLSYEMMEEAAKEDAYPDTIQNQLTAKVRISLFIKTNITDSLRQNLSFLRFFKTIYSRY